VRSRAGPLPWTFALDVALEVVTGEFQAEALILADHAGVAVEGDHGPDTAPIVSVLSGVPTGANRMAAGSACWPAIARAPVAAASRAESRRDPRWRRCRREVT